MNAYEAWGWAFAAVVCALLAVATVANARWPVVPAALATVGALWCFWRNAQVRP